MRIDSFRSVFILSLFLIVLYETLMLPLALSGISFQKILLTCLLWVVIILALLNLIKTLKIFREDCPKTHRILIYMLFAWHIFNIARGLKSLEVPLSTAFGNIYNILGLLTPLSIGFAMNLSNVNKLFNYVKLITPIFLPSLILLFICGDEGVINILGILIIILWPVLFLSPLGLYFKRHKLNLFLLSLTMCAAAYIIGDRTLLLRLLLLIFTMPFLFFTRKGILKWMRKYLIFLVLIPFFLLAWSINSGESIFKFTKQSTSGDDLLHDTRTFLYIEVFEDLTNAKSLWIGKGAMGTYYSDFFHHSGGDTENRNHVEVGVLSIMLKMGIIGYLLHAAILLSAAYMGMYRSNNSVSFGIGLILLQYFGLMFLKYPIAFTLDNFLLWFFIGISSSRRFRQMSDFDLLKNKAVLI